MPLRLMAFFAAFLNGTRPKIYALFFVAIEAVDGRNRPEQAIRFTVDSCSEEQSVSGSRRPIVSKREGPESVDGQQGVVGIRQESFELVRKTIKRSDPAAAEIADENRIAELAEIASGPYDAPRRIEPVAVLQVPDVSASGSKDFDESKPGPRDIIVFRRVLLGISDEDAAANVLNIKGREALPSTVVVAVMAIIAVAIAVQSERIIAQVDAFEGRVVDFDFAGAEIGDVKEFVAVDLSRRCAFVNGALCRSVVGFIHLEFRVWSRGPRGDRSILRRENKMSGLPVFQ